MKPSTFDYYRPASVAEAVELLAGGDAKDDVGGSPGGKVLAGGQSLVPLLNMRLAAPTVLIDINALGAELASVDVTADRVRLGALTRHAQTERSEVAFAALPLLRQATGHVAHPTIRNRGTTVGSIVHADPAGEMPAVLLLCDGTVEATSTSGTRTIAAADLFLGPLESSLRSDELVVAATFAVAPLGTGTAWVEISRRVGDYALCGLGMEVTLDADLRVVRARAAYISVGPTPVLVDLTDAVAGQAHLEADWGAAGRLAQGVVEPDDDIHASAEYRRHLVGVLTARAGREAAAHARSRRTMSHEIPAGVS